MIIQSNPNYKLEVKVTWLSPDLMHLKFITQDDSLGLQERDYFLAPEELSLMTDYINDTLAL